VSEQGIPAGAIKLAERTHYVPGLTNSGWIDGLVIDTGPEESVYHGLGVDTLAVTHGHADHFACAPALRASGARVLAARDDASLVENPDINIRGMFSWASPGDALVTKLFKGDPCEVDGELEHWEDPRATPVTLPGHTLGHTGILTCDGVLFSGDALYEEPLWTRHPLPYAIDPDLVAASLDRIRELPFDTLVPGHGEPVSRAEALRHLDFHQGQIAGVFSLVGQLLAQPRTTEEVIALVSQDRCLGDNPAQYWLAVTTVKGYLGDLLNRGEIDFYVKAHAGWWVRKGGVPQASPAAAPDDTALD
jgi:glyoxylase-like metal-dependent hydrolase (beta-lactamase superfamily II)